ncbi:MAG: NAD(P)H-dependent oxidoreductase [Bacillota bacterium]|nr:NAD(P)H-dependent oxidoreductase [Bacillota bacterium]
MKVLFVNCCVRGEASRTLRLCRAALEQIQETLEDVTIEELTLDKEEILPLNSQRLAQRHELEERGAFDDPSFRYARQFAAADLVVIGAPYWEYQFPALLRCYLEQISVCGLTFVYTEDGRPKGLCKAERLFYITTAGGPILHRNCGFDYIKTLCGDMLGFTQMDWAAAECLDVWGEDVEGRLRQAEAELRDKIKAWK